jgi:hypothetical protein
MSARRLSPILVAACLVALGGCARPAAAPAAGSPTASPTTSSTATASRHHADIAATEADRILAAFVPPTGATRLAAEPPGAPGLDGMPGAGTLVQRTGWWRAAGNPSDVLARLATPAGATLAGSGATSGVTDSLMYAWAAQRGVLAQRELDVGSAADGSDTILRVDAVVVYFPDRPAATLIPTTVRVAVVALDSRGLGMVTDRDEQGPVTVTDAGQIARVVALLNDTPVQIPGARPCPMSVGGTMGIEFRDTVTGPAVATASLATSGCQDGQIQVGAGTPIVISASGLVPTIEEILNLPWPQR